MTREELLASIERRWQVTRDRYMARDARFVELFAAYDGDIWREPPQEHEQRVTVRLVADVVDMDTAILVSRPPVITVPPSSICGVDSAQASLLENAIVGAWNMMDFFQTLHDAVWFASLTGWGVIRGPILVDGRPFPLAAYAADPRCCYPMFTATRKLQWNFYSQYRTAGDVRSEVPPAARRVRGQWHPDALPEDDDAHVLWTEYWGWHGDDLMHAIYVSPVAGSEGRFGTPPTTLPKQGTSGATWQSPGVGNVLKHPTPMNVRGIYTDIPFHYFFPRARPRSEAGMEGMSVADRIDDIQKALSMLATILATDAVNRGTIPFWGDGAITYPVDEQGRGYVDTSPGGYTQVTAGTSLNALPASMDAQLIRQLYELLADVGSRSTFPRAMFGQYEAAMSGIAMSLLVNPVLIRQALAQRPIERCLERFNATLLRMLSRLPAQTTLHGFSRQGAPFSLSRMEIPIGDYVYNVVQLSSSLPKDVAQMIAGLVSLQQTRSLSKRTVMEQVQNLMDLPNKDPEWEFERMAEEDVHLARQNIDTMAAVQAYQTLVAARMQNIIPIGGTQPGTPPQPAQPSGVPAGVAPPQERGYGEGLVEGAGMERREIKTGLVPGPVTGQMGAPQ